MNNYLTAGEFAKLAGTTKRAIQFYDKNGVLKAARINSKGYRKYEEQQILDWQMVHLLTGFGLSLSEIKSFLQKDGDVQKLFTEKVNDVAKQIEHQRFLLANLQKYLVNLKTNGTMVSPTIKVFPAFSIYYIEKVGPYAKIASYCTELANMFVNKGEYFTTLAIFESQIYKPKESRILLGALAKKGMAIKAKYKNAVKKMTFDPGKVITCTHNGESKLLSLFWKELEKYCKINNIKPRKNEPDFEIYRKVDTNPAKQFFEIYIPIN